jgi:pimeloyl-ACP methyl ester carboxylesterase
MRQTRLVFPCKQLATLTVMLCAFSAAVSAQGTPAQKSPQPLGKVVDVGGCRVHLYCTGAGSPAVVIVGAGYSFDWGLVQPEVAKFTQVCTYDHSGIGWSDSGPKDSCDLRVDEVHNALKKAGINGPYVLVGHSLGGLVARLYAGHYADEVAGMVFVDHAMSLEQPPTDDKTPPPPPPPPPPATPGASAPPPPGGIESDPNFSKLSSRDRAFHLWAASQPRSQAAMQTNMEIIPQCSSEADALRKEHPQPLGDKPLVDVSTDEFREADYVKLQADLLALSKNNKEIVAQKSTHFVIIDRPDVVVDAIKQAVEAIRTHTPLLPI